MTFSMSQFDIPWQLKRMYIWLFNVYPSDCGLYGCSHQDVDVSAPEFFRNAKQNGYVPPNKEVRFLESNEVYRQWCHSINIRQYFRCMETSLTKILFRLKQIGLFKFFFHAVVLLWSIFVHFTTPLTFGFGVIEEGTDHVVFWRTKQDIGQPGFTDAEKQRFSKIIARCAPDFIACYFEIFNH